jgi:hypothetical protein
MGSWNIEESFWCGLCGSHRDIDSRSVGPHARENMMISGAT